MVLLDGVVCGDSGNDGFTTAAETCEEVVYDTAREDEFILCESDFVYFCFCAMRSRAEIFERVFYVGHGLRDGYAVCADAVYAFMFFFGVETMAAETDDERDVAVRYACFVELVQDEVEETVVADPAARYVTYDDTDFFACFDEVFERCGADRVSKYVFHFCFDVLDRRVFVAFYFCEDIFFR